MSAACIPVIARPDGGSRRFPACHRSNSPLNFDVKFFDSDRKESVMPRILIIHGAGMNMRGKVQTEIFGPMTLPQYDERIHGYADDLGLDVEIFHSNIEGDIVNKLYEASDHGFDAAIFNPAAFGSGYPALVAAISQVKFPTIEVHISNPIRRGPASQTAAVSQGVVAGFGVAGYDLALRGIRDLLATQK
jgi:3-dehydroquinate dehydratase-2